MPKRLTLAAATALALGLAMPVAAEETPTAETVVATVNGKDITLGHLILVRASLPQQYSQLPDEAKDNARRFFTWWSKRTRL